MNTTNMNTTDNTESETFEDLMSKLRELGLPTYTVTVSPPGYPGVEKVTKFVTFEEARSFAHEQLADMPNVDSCGREDVPSEHRWSIIIRTMYEDPSKSGDKTFLAGWRHGGSMAHPNSKVFVAVFGRDCDGYTWDSYHEFSSLHEAATEIERVQAAADGPSEWSLISQDTFESI